MSWIESESPESERNELSVRLPKTCYVDRPWACCSRNNCSFDPSRHGDLGSVFRQEQITCRLVHGSSVLAVAFMSVSRTSSMDAQPELKFNGRKPDGLLC